MLLIMFMGLVAELALVSGNCTVGNLSMTGYDFAKSTGTWFVLLHKSNDVENNLTCVTATYGPAMCNISQVNVTAYRVNTNISATLQGTATYRSGNVVDESFNQQTIWNGRYCVVATDYVSYVILQMCSSVTNQLYFYVAFRSKQPDSTTLMNAAKAMQQSNVNFSQPALWRTDNCPWEGPSPEGGSSA